MIGFITKPLIRFLQGAKWEWSGETKGDWHIYDMEVQVVIEDAWSKGEQTVDISTFFPGCPYIMNFCNLTQVRKTTGFVRPMRRVQQAAYPMVKLTQAEVAAMVGRREERRKLAIEEIERRNNIKNKKEKKRRSKSKDRGLPRIEGKKLPSKAVRKLMNSFLGKDHKNNLFGVKDHHDKDDLIRTRERRLSAPNSNVSLLHSSSRSVAGDRSSRYDTISGSRRVIGHPNSEMNFPAGPGLNGHRPRSQYGPQYQRFKDSSYSSFSDASGMTRRPSIDTISTYLSHETGGERLGGGYRYGYASQNGSYYEGSVGSQELIDVYTGDEDSVFTDDSYSESIGRQRQHSAMMARSQDRLNSTARMSTRSFSLGRSRVLSDPSLMHRYSSPRHRPVLHQHSNSEVVSRTVSRGTIRPYSQDLTELQESFERELYVNQRTLSDEVTEHNKRKKKHKYEYIDDDDDDDSDNSDNGDENDHQFVNPLPLPPKRMLSQSQQSLAISPIKSMSRSQQSLTSSTHSSPGKRQITHSSPYGKRPVPAPRSGLGDLPLPASAPVTPGKRSGSVYASNQSLCPKSNNIDKVIMENSQLVSKPVHVKDTCHICQNSLGAPGGHDPYPDLPSSVISLMRCQHRFHLNCVRVLIDNNPTSIKNQSIHCPDCGRLQRDVLGSMPENGTMSFKVIPKGLPGFEDYHSIQITYNFQNGTQSPKHPSPGKPYFAIGFPKTAFLPDTEQGRTILEMLEKSFNLGHTFLVDEAGDIVWGHIPHRTEFNGEPMTEADLDAVMTALFKIGLGASDC